MTDAFAALDLALQKSRDEQAVLQSHLSQMTIQAAAERENARRHLATVAEWQGKCEALASQLDIAQVEMVVPCNQRDS
jgi:hypothetical protein